MPQEEEEKDTEGTGPGSLGVQLDHDERVGPCADLDKEGEAWANKMMVLGAIGLFVLGLACVAGLMWALKLFLDSAV